jgi:hypothetical protein
MSKLLKKLFISFALASFFLLNFTSIAKAQTNWYNPSFEDFVLKVFDPNNPNEIFGERYTYAQVAWIQHSIVAFVAGQDVIDCVRLYYSGNITEVGNCLSTLQSTSSQGSIGPVFSLALMGDAILTSRPASGIRAVSDVASKIHLIPEAHAQGFGFKTLEPIRTIWKASRNISYLLLVIAIVALAFMIMFRVKISPQAVITIQSALPKIVLAIILITFSYAIAGFIIDLSYVVTGVFGLLLKSAEGISSLSQLELAETLIRGLEQPIGAIFLILLVVALVAAAGGLAVGSLLPIAGWFVAIVILGIFLVIIVIFAFRILILLLTTLVKILLLIIFAPFILLAGIFPGVGGFGQWIKSLIANVAVYPTTIIMIFLAHFFFWSFFGGIGGIGQILAQITSINPYGIQAYSGEWGLISVPGFSGNTTIIGLLIAIALLGLIPSAGNLIRSLIEGKPFAFGTAMREAFGLRQAAGLGMAIPAEYFNIKERTARGVNEPTPGWVQAARRHLGLKS